MLDLQKIQNSKTDELGFFRFKKFDNKDYLITNDVGKYLFLKDKEFEDLLSWKINSWGQYYDLVSRGFIKNDTYESIMSGSTALRNHFVWLGPTLHMIVTTLRCNHKCKYCHAAVAPMTAKEFDMSKETAKKVVDTIFYTNSPSLTIEFQGGESLVNYEVVQYIVDYALIKASHLGKELAFSLVSNLTLMTEDKLSRLLGHWVDICTSLDGNQLVHN